MFKKNKVIKLIACAVFGVTMIVLVLNLALSSDSKQTQSDIKEMAKDAVNVGQISDYKIEKKKVNMATYEYNLYVRKSKKNEFETVVIRVNLLKQLKRPEYNYDFSNLPT